MQPFNKYYPPEWTPDKGTVNKFVGKHPYGDRARKIEEGILIVRFELPFNIWCEGCDNHIGQGVRYNAEKKKIGNYYSTPILQFRMKCHLCDNWIEIHTDPKNSAYVVVSGARKKMEEWKAEDTEVIELQDKETKERLENDVMYRLEHGIEDKKKLEENVPRLSQLQQLNDTQWADPYTRSQQLRKQLREEKKKEKMIREENEKIKDRHSLQIELLPETAKDVIEAKSVEYQHESLDKRILSTAVAPLFKNGLPHENNLSHIVKVHTRLKMDPFYQPNPFTTTPLKKSGHQKRLGDVSVMPVNNNQRKKKKTEEMLVAYTDSDTD